MKKILLPIIFLMGTLPLMAEITETKSGTCGENLTWTLTTDGTLAISGSGEMYDYSSSSAWPWHYYRRDIKSIIFPEGYNRKNEAY